jgi:hypothetical protein
MIAPLEAPLPSIRIPALSTDVFGSLDIGEPFHDMALQFKHSNISLQLSDLGLYVANILLEPSDLFFSYHFLFPFSIAYAFCVTIWFCLVLVLLH